MGMHELSIERLAKRAPTLRSGGSGSGIERRGWCSEIGGDVPGFVVEPKP